MLATTPDHTPAHAQLGNVNIDLATLRLEGGEIRTPVFSPGVLSEYGGGGHILSMAQDSSTQLAGDERRRNPRLRELVDEMLATIRAAHHVDLWTPQERASCEAEMARIMGTVREHAMSRGVRQDH